MSDAILLAVIGGSGVYEFPGLENTVERTVDTPFGPTSAPIVVGDLDGKRVAFLARHGIGHRLNPSEVPYQANIFALKALGAERIVSISACGSLREDMAPGHIVVPDQLFDLTRNRARSFFGNGIVVHLSSPDPFCPELSAHLGQAAQTVGATLHRGGTFITIEGPRFSTKAESGIYRSWGMSIIGMTTAPEAFLAREAEMCYAVMAHVTDYDVWHADAASVTVELVVQTLQSNAALAQRTIRELVRQLPAARGCQCPQALAGAIITAPSAIPTEQRHKLAPLIGKYIPA
jgi:5'-methylthioadenosine phosphorylase